MQTDRADDLLTAGELGARLRVRPGTILAWYRGGRISARRLSPKVLRFSLVDVLKALDASVEAAGREDGR
jgi:hypothetical protein